MSGGNAIETSYAFETIRYYGDRTLGYDFGAGQPGFRTSWLPTADCLGIPQSGFNQPHPVSMAVHRPDHIAYSGRSDYESYYAAGSSFFSGNTDTKAFHDEHSVIHTTYRGDIQDTDGDSGRLFNTTGPYPDSLIFQDGQIPIRRYNGSTNSEYLIQYWGRYGRLIGTNSKGEGVFDTPPISPYAFNFASFDLIEQIRSLNIVFSVGTGIYTYPVFGPYSARVTNFVDNGSYQNLNRLFVDAEYDYEFIWNNTYSVKYHVHKLIHIGVVANYGNNLPTDSNYAASETFPCNDYSTVELVSHNYPATGLNVGSIPRMVVVHGTIDGDLLQTQAGSLPNFVVYRFADKQYLNRRTDLHKGVFDSLLSDIRPSSFLSAADALNKHLLALSTNHIQTLQHLSSILDLLPELTKLPSLVSRLERGDLGALKDLIDYISGEILRFKFTQAPAGRALKEFINSDVKSVLNSLAKSYTYTIYGDFEYEIPQSQNPYGDGKLLLVTRSKISLSQDLSTMMESILMANSVGLLPTLSRLWEIIPFSFVVDWFTGMNRRLKLVDTQLAYMMFRTNWCLHSYKLSYYPSAEALADYGLLNVSDEKPFNISTYMREKSAYMPRLRDSRFDFLAASGTSPVTAGALAWQLFT